MLLKSGWGDRLTGRLTASSSIYECWTHYDIVGGNGYRINAATLKKRRVHSAAMVAFSVDSINQYSCSIHDPTFRSLIVAQAVGVELMQLTIWNRIR